MYFSYDFICKALQKGSKMKHGKRKTSIYRTYAHMKERCNNPNCKDYKYYGEKGVKVCEEWQDNFQAFYDWAMVNGYNDTLTIDRINVNGDYTPDNCRWVTMKVQCNNKSCNIQITYNGKTQNLKQWSDELGISYRTLYQRISVRHWDTDKALGTKENASIKQITYNGKTQTMKEWANEVGINYRTLAARLNQYHWSIEKALTTK